MPAEIHAADYKITAEELAAQGKLLSALFNHLQPSKFTGLLPVEKVYYLLDEAWHECTAAKGLRPAHLACIVGTFLRYAQGDEELRAECAGVPARDFEPHYFSLECIRLYTEAGSLCSHIKQTETCEYDIIEYELQSLRYKELFDDIIKVDSGVLAVSTFSQF